MSENEKPEEVEEIELTKVEKAELTVKTHMELVEAKEILKERDRQETLKERQKALEEARKKREGAEEEAYKISEKVYKNIEKAYDYLLKAEKDLQTLDTHIADSGLTKVNRHTFMNKKLNEKSPNHGDEKGTIMKALYAQMKYFARFFGKLVK